MQRAIGLTTRHHARQRPCRIAVANIREAMAVRSQVMRDFPGDAPNFRAVIESPLDALIDVGRSVGRFATVVTGTGLAHVACTIKKR